MPAGQAVERCYVDGLIVAVVDDRFRLTSEVGELIEAKFLTH